tara:strand:+ start:239 stop:1483 length:1245 start_codon:yes stop_codon:yes gene_type:complete
MGKKYLETKGTSLESSILGMWEEEAARVDGRTKSYKEHRARLEARRIKAENKKKSMNEGSKEEYEKFFNSALKKFKIDSPADLKSDEEKKKFFNYVDKNYTGEKDEEFGTFIKEKMKEGLENSPNKANSQHLCAKNVVHEEWGEGHPVHGMHAIPNSEGEIAWYDVMFEHGIEKGVSINELNVIFETSHENHDKDDDDKKMLSAGKMSQLHQMIKDKKSAEEIAKAMKLDVKTVKALMSNYNMEEVDLEEGEMNAQYEMMKKEMMNKVEMMKAEKDPSKMEMMKKEMMKEMENMPEMMKKEMMGKMEMAMKEEVDYDLEEGKKYEHGIGKVNSAFEIGTPEYRQHTQSITPGQEITDYQQFKVESMKEALAKVWGLDEAKKEEKDLTKKVKGSTITMTGKKSDEIDTKPEIKEK